MDSMEKIGGNYEKINSEEARKFLDTASDYVKETYKLYENLTKINYEK